MKINQSNFNIIYNKILFNIENYLDNFNSKNDIDYENNYQMMIISFSKTNKIIISKQESLKQIWLATRDNGYHFNYQNSNWICNRSKRNFWSILEESFYLQGKEKVNFKKFLK
ncbi:iron donor protein CyaY [Buchnera aphidicola]|uniref:Iron-sulfur cluster assembly protein CyaY n=1 Tax=Buchnera aphidicola (Therioaphis trifolii) TaxID=1241884 RepID=A0A4D6YDP9_9GAMM|nr:iron donor protein CyaY [Buchnera aphidicola]QCI27379.1 iron donor protein CyaY [Buchnera aphidicola (Therioaphis trifolii)]